MTDDDDDLQLRALLKDNRQPDDARFAAGFADRVMQRVADDRAMEDDPTVAIERAIIRQTRRLLPALVAASFALTMWNWWNLKDSVDSPVAAALGIQPVTVASASNSSALTNVEAFQ